MTYSEHRFSKFEKFASKSVFGGAPVHVDVIEFSNFLLQLKDQRSECKTVYRCSIGFILRGIMMFYSQRVHAFC